MSVFACYSMSNMKMKYLLYPAPLKGKYFHTMWKHFILVPSFVKNKNNKKKKTKNLHDFKSSIIQAVGMNFKNKKNCLHFSFFTLSCTWFLNTLIFTRALNFRGPMALPSYFFWLASISLPNSNVDWSTNPSKLYKCSLWPIPFHRPFWTPQGTCSFALNTLFAFQFHIRPFQPAPPPPSLYMGYSKTISHKFLVQRHFKLAQCFLVSKEYSTTEFESNSQTLAP